MRRRTETGSFIRDHFGAVSLSVLMHLAIVMLMVFSVSFSRSRVVTAPQPSAIEVVMIDQDPAAVLAEIRENERLERERVERERERQEQERVRLEREQQEAERQAEEQRRLEVERQREEEARIAAEEEARQREEERRREEERLAEERRRAEERLAEERRREEARRQQEARERAIMEEELQRALAAEREVMEARRSGEFDRYIRRIQVAIEQAWIPPASAGPGLECIVYVTQIPSGDVTNARIGDCNGDAAVRRSIEAAVLRASPLPTPAIPALFDRNLEVTFRPQF